MVFLFISVGLLIGVIIGYQDVSVLYEAVQRNKQGRSYGALFFVAIALFLGVYLNRDGTSIFIAELSMVYDLKAAAIISLSALLTTFGMRLRFKIISITHALFGSIIGWLLFIGYVFPINKVLYVIAIWLLTPILSFFLASGILTLSYRIIKKSKIHIFKMDLIFNRITLLVMLMAAFSLGANNSANITGVYLLSFSNLKIRVLDLEISAQLILFILAALSIVGGFLISQFIKKEKKQKLVFELSTEANFSILLTYAIIFFLFSSTTLQEFLHFIGLPGYDLIPISTFHVLAAGLVGISYKKGYSIYNKEAMIKLPVKSILTPLIAGLFTFILLLIINFIFGDNTFFPDQHPLDKSNYFKEGVILSINDWNTIYNISVIAIFVLLILLGYFFFTRMQKRLTVEKRNVQKQAITMEAEKDFFKEELKYSNKTGDRLKKEIDLKNVELEKFALQLVEKEKILSRLKKVTRLLKYATSEVERENAINEINLMITESLNLAKERELFYSSVSTINSDFFIRLSQQYSNLSENEKRLIALIKLGLSSKEIASLSNITTKSVEMNRYRLRKKLNLPPDLDLITFINQI
jgi:phosphate/sulfate permease/DNA-binding CsgD family transcriptional regulator